MRYDKMDHEGRGSVPYTQPGILNFTQKAEPQKARTGKPVVKCFPDLEYSATKHVAGKKWADKTESSNP